MADAENPFHELLTEHMERGTGNPDRRHWMIGSLADQTHVSLGSVIGWTVGRQVPSPPSFGHIYSALFGSNRGLESSVFEVAWQAARARRKAHLLLTPTIPPQKSGPHFAIGPDSRLQLVPPFDLDADGNNLRRIADLLPLVRQAAEALGARIGPDHNTFGDLGRILAQYRGAIAASAQPIS